MHTPQKKVVAQFEKRFILPQTPDGAKRYYCIHNLNYKLTRNPKKAGTGWREKPKFT